MFDVDPVAEIREELALRRHMNNYHWLADNWRWDDWAQLLTEDSVFEHVSGGVTFRGRKEIRELCAGELERNYQACQHIIANCNFVLTSADTATGTGNLWFVGIPDTSHPKVNSSSGGRYQWKFVKTVDGWRTSHTRLHVVWEAGSDVASMFETPTTIGVPTS